MNAPLGSASSRPAVSRDGRYIALVSPAQNFQILFSGDSDAVKLLHNGPLPRIPPPFLSHLVVLRWAPTGSEIDAIPWLALSDGSRIIVINPESLLANDQDFRRYIVADYQLGDQFGKLAYADFFLSQAHVVVLFEATGSASILSTASAQRDDVANLKYRGSNTLVRSMDLRSLLVLQRVQGQDQATMLGLQGDGIVVQSSFSLPTNDAQGAMFSPNKDPVLAVWDSSAHGTSIFFFSSMGHPLKQLNITAFGISSGLDALGVSKISWSGATADTVLAVADSNKQVLVRRQNNRGMSIDDHCVLQHPATINGSKSIVWQQAEGGEFTLQKRAFDAVLNPQAGGDLTLLELNADQTFVATTPLDNPKSVWLWQPEHPDPHTVIVMRDPVRQLLWHPRNAHVLVITTHSKTPEVFVWYSESRPPSICPITLANISSSKFEGTWLEADEMGRHSFVLTSTRAVNMGHLREEDGGVIFTSALRDNDFGSDLDGDTTSMSTPSKPSKKTVDAGGAW